MADTVGSIAAEVLRMLRVYSPRESINAADLSEMVLILNSMLDQWSIESLSCYAILQQRIPLQVGVFRYSIGPGGVINDTRPVRLIEGPGAAYVQDTNNNNYPVEVVGKDYWNQIGLRDTTSNIPTILYYDNQFPLGYLNVFPVPNIEYSMYFDSFQQLGQFADANAPVAFPPGYKEAIKNNWAVLAKPYFKGAQLDSIIMVNANQGKRLLKRSNRRTPVAIFDSYIVSRGVPTYNIYNDSSNP